jgi:hypothetical protein
MWPDDAHWYPHMLAGDCFLGRFRYDAAEALTEAHVEVVDPRGLPHGGGEVLVHAPQASIVAAATASATASLTAAGAP